MFVVTHMDRQWFVVFLFFLAGGSLSLAYRVNPRPTDIFYGGLAMNSTYFYASYYSAAVNQQNEHKHKNTVNIKSTAC